jgi:EAL domain-containing protein (putative c-di-GMP-specific phosphodiesterase class I)
MGIMDALTSAVIDLAIDQLARWKATTSAVSVAINVSGQNLDSGEFVDQLTRRSAATGLEPESLAVELTETAAMRNPVRAMEMLTRLRLKGFHLSLDDFGTGYSSLVQLQRLPFSELKIDRAFVMGCHTSHQSRVIVKTMIDLAHNLGLITVAEGVDCVDHIRVLQQLGCDIVQGYFIGRPMTAEAATEWMRKGAASDRMVKPEVG